MTQKCEVTLENIITKYIYNCVCESVLFYIYASNTHKQRVLNELSESCCLELHNWCVLFNLYRYFFLTNLSHLKSLN